MRDRIRDYELKQAGKLWIAIVYEANMSPGTATGAIHTGGYVDSERGKQP